MNDRRFRLRVTYSIEGRLSMLSHLELARTLERIVRRAGLPFAVSNGFSPHMKISFGSALPVGVGGRREIFDLQLIDYISLDKVKAALVAATAPGIEILDCKYIENSEAAASVALPVSVYEAVLSEPIDSLDVPDEIEVKRKKKDRIVNVSDHLVGDVDIDADTVTFTLVALDTGSLRPDVFMKACLFQTFSDDEGSKAPVHVLRITRIDQRSAVRC
ncbi:MAG: DUF2344 domain-containing protein [Eggerthellaceae bacterium]|nr:DUF2344 domain-containing protein [Eggerthellaceae bacterium]